MSVGKTGNEKSAAASCTPSPEVDQKWPMIGTATGEE